MLWHFLYFIVSILIRCYVVGGCRISGKSSNALAIAAGLMGLDKDELKHCLTSRVMQSGKGGMKGTVIM